MGTRSKIHGRHGNFRKNHDPDTTADRETNRFHRKYGKPYRSLKAAKLWLDRELERSFMSLEEAKERGDKIIDPVLRRALSKWIEMDSRYRQWRKDTQLKGKGVQNKASKQLEDRITERAFAMVGVTRETPAITTQRAWAAQKLIHHAKTSPAVLRDLLKEDK